MSEPISPERLDYMRAQTNKAQESGDFAHAICQVMGQDLVDLLDEVGRLRAKLDLPCGSCHPCTEWAAETWRRAGGKLPHKDVVDEAFAERDQLRAMVERVKAAAFTQERDEWHGVELLDEIRAALEARSV